jgi:hypothetical protein
MHLVEVADHKMDLLQHNVDQLLVFVGDILVVADILVVGDILVEDDPADSKPYCY